MVLVLLIQAWKVRLWRIFKIIASVSWLHLCANSSRAVYRPRLTPAMCSSQFWGNSQLSPLCGWSFMYRVSLKKGTFSIFVLFLLKKSDLTFHMCFRIRILSPFQLAAKIISTQNPNCSKNAENTCANMLFIPVLRCEAWAVASLHTSIYLITRF